MISRTSPPRAQLKSQPVSVPSGPSETPPVEPATENSRWSGPVDLGRVGWLMTVGLLVVGTTVLAFKRDWGYAIVTGAVALSAAINLF
jgi:hypothetical protein